MAVAKRYLVGRAIAGLGTPRELFDDQGALTTKGLLDAKVTGDQLWVTKGGFISGAFEL